MAVGAHKRGYRKYAKRRLTARQSRESSQFPVLPIGRAIGSTQMGLTAPDPVQRKSHSTTYRQSHGQYAERRLAARLCREVHIVLPIGKAISNVSAQGAVQGRCLPREIRIVLPIGRGIDSTQMCAWPRACPENTSGQLSVVRRRLPGHANSGVGPRAEGARRKK